MNRIKIISMLTVALLLSNAIILWARPEWLWLRLPAALLLTFLLPGWSWLPLFRWLQAREALERGVVLIGLSSLLSAQALLIAVLIPGPFVESRVMIALNVVILLGLLGQLALAIRTGARAEDSPLQTPAGITWPSRMVMLILLGIMAVAMFTRLTRLGYAEFHEDELENMRLIVQAYKGESYAPFIDTKGPIHWLLPAALWYLNGWLTEGIARAPFALTSLLLIPTVYLLGRRMSGRDSIGLIAAGIVALNGFFVAYGRFVENQSLIVFWGALAVLWLYRYYQEDAPQFLPWIAFALGVGLVAHPDVLLYLPVFAYLIGIKLYQDRSSWRRQWRWLAGSALLFAGLLALFYVPYFSDPSIGLARDYFAEERIGESLLYNRVDNLFVQDSLYSSRYYAPSLSLLLAWLLFRQFSRWGRWGWLVLGGLGLAMATTLLFPQAWLVAGFTLAFIPYAALTLLVLSLPRISLEIKLLFLWMMAPLGALLFLAKDAADHIQIAYPAWALLAGWALTDLWACLSYSSGDGTEGIPSFFRGLSPTLRTTSKVGLVLALGLVSGIVLLYQYLAFDARITTYWAARLAGDSNPNHLYNWLYGSLPQPRKIFSNPRLGGWKAVGYLWETGALSGDFRSMHESFAVPVWYTFQTPRSCYNDPQHYWLQRHWASGWDEAESETLRQSGYSLTRIVLVDQQPKLHLYEKNVLPREPEIVDMEAYRRQFDLLATPARFAEAETIPNPASLNFGDKLLLRGYDLPATVRVGELLPVTVYWEALAPMPVRYRAFVHLVGEADQRWGQHDDDPACRLLTPDMRPGQQSSRQFRVPVDPATPPGEYQVILGLYHPDTLERLSIWDNERQQSPGDSFLLGKIRVEKEPTQ